jgi:hypothetical protein
VRPQLTTCMMGWSGAQRLWRNGGVHDGKRREATQLGIAITTSETAYTQSAETVYDIDAFHRSRHG